LSWIDYGKVSISTLLLGEKKKKTQRPSRLQEDRDKSETNAREFFSRLEKKDGSPHFSQLMANDISASFSPIPSSILQCTWLCCCGPSLPNKNKKTTTVFFHGALPSVKKKEKTQRRYFFFPQKMSRNGTTAVVQSAVL
jgi:hypothetical protein